MLEPFRSDLPARGLVQRAMSGRQVDEGSLVLAIDRLKRERHLGAIENLGAAIMAVGAQQDLGVGPMGSDRAQQPAEEGFDLLAARPLGGTKHGSD